MTPNRDTELRELAAKWRAQAASERREVAFSNDERSVMNVRCALLEGCADELESLLARPEAAQVGDDESTAIYLRRYDATMIGQAKHAGQDMVSVLAHLHPTDGWDVRFNVAALSAAAKGEGDE